MLRKLLILGVFAGTSASIPIVYQSNPQMLDGLLKSTVASKPAAQPQPELNLASVPDKPAGTGLFAYSYGMPRGESML